MFQNGNIPGGFGPFANIGSTARSGLTLSGFLNGASKTLTTINQVIPIMYQVGPMFKNAKTMLKVANQFSSIPDTKTITTSTPKKEEVTTKQETSTEKLVKFTNPTTNYQGGPTFFQ